MTSLTKGVYSQRLSGTMQISTVAMFAALAIVLNRLVAVPAPFLGFLYYEVWEIPIVVAFILFGPRIAIPSAILNFFVLLMFPGVILAGPLYNLVAILAMLSGIFMGFKLANSNPVQTTLARITLSTCLGITLRVVVMTGVNASLLQLAPPLGFGLSFSAIYPLLPLIAFFNGTIALYTIPAAYAITRATKFRRH
jgi:riboflavin transporter FmnP